MTDRVREIFSPFKGIGKKILLRISLDRKHISSLKGLLVLCYHSIPVKGNWYYDISKSDFEQHLKYLSERFEIIRVSDFIDGKTNTDHPMIALTFDDGYEDNYTNLYPLLEKNDAPATIFVTADYIQEETNRVTEPIPGIKKRMMTWKQLRELSDCSLIDIGSHGMHHIKMPELIEDDLRKELLSSKITIESHIEDNVSLFAYPGGFFNDMTTSLLKQVGYKGGFTSFPRINNSATDKFEIGRVGIARRQSDVSSLSYLITRTIGRMKD